MYSLNTSKSEYRPDIDGIRALAVLSVFFFHLQPSLLPGGFLGVDVFFVISGYLITGIILRENHLNEFSFIHFYARRVKRIFPALFIVLLLSAFVAVFFLPPDTYANFMASARYASGQLSNIFFSRDVGYFDEGFSGQPLLHTWSLGVEEQFYLFWPLLIYFCFRFFRKAGVPYTSRTVEKPRVQAASIETVSGDGVQIKSITQAINRKIAGAMLLLSLGSFIVCFSLAETHYNLAFYMFYTRILEFCIGGLIALRILPDPGTKTLNGVIGATGGLLLCYSFLFVSEEYLGVSFLKFGVLLPCVGTALVIHAHWQKSVINRLFAMKLPVYIGRISYSLYLYHWPVIIFWKLYSNTNDISISASLGIILVSFLLSILSYLLVEQPCRKARLPDRRILALASAVVIIFALSFGNLEKYETAPWRITSYMNEGTTLPKISYPDCDKTEKDGIEFYKCNKTSESEQPIVALVGDSHSPHFLNSTTTWAKKNGYDVEFYALAACPVLLGDIRIKSGFGEEHDENCRQISSRFESQIVDDPRVEIVFLAHRFDLFHTGLTFQKKTRRTITFINDEGIPVKDHTSYYRARLSDTVNTLKQKGKDVIILKQVPLFDGAKDCNWEPRINQLLGKERICDYDTAFIGKWQQPSIDFIDEFTAAHQVPVFDPVPFFDRPLHDGTNLYGDSDHLNEYGKQFLVPYFVKAIDELMSGKIQKKASSITQMSQ